MYCDDVNIYNLIYRNMKNPDKTSRISIGQVSGKVDTLVSQLWKIEDLKSALLRLLNGTGEIINIFWKMKLGKIISSREKATIIDFFQNGDVKIWKSDKWIFFQGILDWNRRKSDLAKFIAQYPLVVDADKIMKISEEDPLIIIEKDEETRFLQIVKDDKWDPSIRFSSGGYRWFVLVPKDDPDNKQLIEIIQWNQTIFLQKKGNPNGIIDIQEIANFVGEHKGGFDKDNLAVLYKENSMFSIIHKSELADWTFQVKEVLLFKKPSWVAIKFDEYNSFEAEHPKIGKVICKKRYNESWELLWIDTFKKLRLGWEKRINSQSRSIDWLTSRG